MSLALPRAVTLAAVVSLLCVGSGPSHAQDPACAPVKGIADLHSHQFSSVAFGGRLLWGHSFHPDGPAAALPPCGDEDLLCTPASLVPACVTACAGLDACIQGCHASACRPGAHGPGGTHDLIGWSLGEKATVLGALGHDVRGFPSFAGWPASTSFTHQQMFYQWLHRAFQGGLRLVVVLAVNNEVLCQFAGPAPGLDCNDMHAVDRQLQSARALEVFVDEENDGQRNGNGWYRIAASASQARRIIADGALAVVLGTEVSTLFDCYADSGRACSPPQLADRIRHYYDLGVRHVFPVHVFDNGFGGTGANLDFFNYGNAVIYDQLVEVEDCSSQGYEFAFGGANGALASGLSLLKSFFGLPYNWTDYPDAQAHCNVRGLTPLGAQLVGQMMDRGMVIDVDHMSARMRDAVLDRAEQRGYPAITAGHASFTELSAGAPDPNRNGEGNTTPAELARIFSLGGMAAPIQSQGTTEEVASYVRPGGLSIPNDCGDSSKTWAQAYLYAVDRMGGRDVAAVGLGSDWNGFAGQPAPRFGPNACNGDLRAPQLNPVTYPFALHDSIGGTLERHEFAGRSFDINTDGLAQVGLLPDFIADLGKLGLSDRDLDPLFRSAEGYLAMWEKVENAPVVLALPQSIEVNEGSPLPALSFLDADCDDVWKATLDHGDGTQSVVLALERALQSPHVYADDGLYTLAVALSDVPNGGRTQPTSDSAFAQVTVHNVAPAVHLAAPGRIEILEGELLELEGVGFSDPGTLDTHTATVSWGAAHERLSATVLESPSGPPGLAAGAKGRVAASHKYGRAGGYTVEVCVTDDDGGRGCASFEVEVRNAPPDVAIPAGVTLNEGDELSLALAGVSFLDGSALDTHVATVNWGEGQGPQQAPITEPGAGPGLVQAAHVYEQDGSFAVEVCVTDQGGSRGCASFHVDVNNVPPKVDLGLQQAQVECGVDQARASVTVSDPGVRDMLKGSLGWGEGSKLIDLPGAPPWAVSHAYGKPGSYTVTAAVADDDATGAAGASITVVDTQPPQFLQNPAPITIPASDPAGTPFDVPLPTATDLCSPVVTVTSDSPGIFKIGTTAVTVEATDASGNTATLSTTVSVTNRPPIALPQSVTTEEDTAVGIVLAGSDPDGHEVTLKIVGQPANGTLSGAAPALSYAPKPNFNGGDSFEYAVSDGFGGVTTAWVSIQVRPVNDAPVAIAQTLQVAEDKPLVFTLKASDPDGDLVQMQLGGQPAHGTLSGDGSGTSEQPPTLTYTPHADFSGSDALAFVVFDGAASTTGSITIQVLPVNDAPVALPLRVATREGVPVTVTLAGSDVEGDRLAFSATTPSSGSLTGTPPQLTYTPKPGFSGSDSFSYAASDGQLSSTSARVTIEVAPDADGRMQGTGHLEDKDRRLDFHFRAFDKDSKERGQVSYSRSAHGKKRKERDPDGHFQATQISAVTLSDDGAIRPGIAKRPTIDTAVMTGVGKWNGRPRYAFELRAADAGEPGRGRDRFEIVIKDPTGAVVAEIGGTLDAGNIQSRRLTLGRASR